MPPTVQLSLPAGTVLPLSLPPAPPTTTMTHEGCHDVITFCKSKILPDPKHQDLLKHDIKSPTRVLAAALYAVLERKYFKERTSRSDISSMFSITTAQLTKAVTGIDYASGPKTRKRKTDADSTTPSKLTKTSAGIAPPAHMKPAHQQECLQKQPMARVLAKTHIKPSAKANPQLFNIKRSKTTR